MKELRDKVKDLLARYTEAKSQLDITKQELKKIQKVKLDKTKKNRFLLILSSRLWKKKLVIP